MVNFQPSLHAFFLAASFVACSVASEVVERAPDPCAVVGGQKWVSPKDLRACYTSFKVDQAAKANIIEVLEKTFAFHTSTNYQIQAPPPYHLDVHEDLLADLARIKRSRHASDYEQHIDLSRSVKRMQDGHAAWINYCYVTLYVSYLPTPLSLITGPLGIQSVHIAAEAFSVASAEFPDQIQFWQDALPGKLKGQLATLSGAKVLLINGKDPIAAVNANAAIAGSYQAFGTRQNGFFSSYQRVAGGWNYIMGQFAQQALPLDDSVTLTIVRQNHTLPETVTIPYRARFGTVGQPFTDTASWRANNCQAVEGTNGVDIYADGNSARQTRKQPMNILLEDAGPISNVVLPPELIPSLAPLDGSRNAAQFYLMDDKKTGVLALGSFSDTSYFPFLSSLLAGLQSLKDAGATQLIVDVTNNGGGYICAAHYLHRLIVGPSPNTEPNAGLDTTCRNGPLAQLIVKKIVNENKDPNVLLNYNPVNWADANSNPFNETTDWLQPVYKKIINGRPDAFSQRLGTDCPAEFAYPTPPPDTGFFDPKKVVIVSNGRCASSCSLFSIAMHKKEGSKTVVWGNKHTPQQYCGIVGGQSTDFENIDSEIKTTGLKNHTLAPPDLVVHGVIGITWRLGYGVWNKNAPEEWENRPADLNLPITAALANNPVAIWTDLAKRFFK